MLFNSLGYLAFLVVALASASLLPRRKRFYLLGAFSVLFYAMWRWEFTLLILTSAVVDFICAQRIYRSSVPLKRKAWVLLSLTVNLGILVFFKYTYFLHKQVWRVCSVVGLDFLQEQPALQIILPLGVSFYTFQTISYTLDVYRGAVKPTRSFPLFFTYVSFWPQLVAGPILRANEVIPQLEAPESVSLRGVAEGTKRLLRGLFKKVVIADSLATLVEHYFDGTGDLTGPDVWVMCFAFGFQIYCDFSGYSDIAIGSARMVGIAFPENFNWPYLAKSPRDFWLRWHISLSAWIRDYLYLPLTGRTPSRSQSTGGIAEEPGTGGRGRGRGLFITWVIMGFWHGAGWTFGLWGLYHAVVIYLHRKIRFLRSLPEHSPTLAWIVTLFIVMAGWIPFRSHSVGQALSLLGKLANPMSYVAFVAERRAASAHYLIVLSLVAAMCLAHRADRSASGGERRWEWAWRAGSVCMYAAFTVSIILCLRPGNQFIYFQF